MGYKCEATGLELDDFSAKEIFYCNIFNEKKSCIDCDNSKYQGIIAGYQIRR
ncbi:MAG: hypothetical protein WA130_21480 [Candidatus Methanoperedens sp.]